MPSVKSSWELNSLGGIDAPPRAPDALGQARTLAARIRNTRMGNGLGGGVSIPEMIEEDRR